MSDMKYIRTKNGIFEYTADSEAFDGVYTTTMGINHLILYKEIVKQADTIPELCDEVCCDNEIQLLVNRYINETKAQMIKNTVEELFCKGKKDVYGAIWTDKGLIYVAKLNDKGELELL